MKLYFKKIVLTSATSFIYLIVLLSSNISYSQDLSLKEAHQLMLQKNGDLKASHYEVNALKEEMKATKGLFYPKISISGTYMNLDKDISVDLNHTRDLAGGLLEISNPAETLGNWDITLQDKNFGFAFSSINWPIFAGGKIKAAYEAAEIKFELSQNHHQIKENSLTVNLINYYYSLKLAKEAENLRKKVYETVKIHYHHAEKLYENGIIPEVETLNAKVALSNAKRELLAAQKDVSLAKSAIKNLVGGSTFSSTSTSFIEPTILASLNEFQQQMLQGNEQLHFLEQNKKLAKVGVKVEKSDYYPKVALMGSHKLWKDNMPLIETNWAVGAGVTWDLFDGFQRDHKIKAAKYKVSQVEMLEKQAQLNLNTYTEKLYNEMAKQQEQYLSLNNDEKLAERLKFMRVRAFEEGTGTSLEVIDATLKQTQIILHKLNALYHYNIAYGELMVSLGKTETFLNQI